MLFLNNEILLFWPSVINCNNLFAANSLVNVCSTSNFFTFSLLQNTLFIRRHHLGAIKEMVAKKILNKIVSQSALRPDTALQDFL
jgi:hypothetical protein